MVGGIIFRVSASSSATQARPQRLVTGGPDGMQAVGHRPASCVRAIHGVTSTLVGHRPVHHAFLEMID